MRPVSDTSGTAQEMNGSNSRPWTCVVVVVVVVVKNEKKGGR